MTNKGTQFFITVIISFISISFLDYIGANRGLSFVVGFMLAQILNAVFDSDEKDKKSQEEIKQ